MTAIMSTYYVQSSNHFSAIGLPTSAEEIIYRVEHGENVIFAFAKDDCPSCESFVDNAGRQLWTTKYRISYIDKDTKEAAETISKYAVDNGLDRTLSHPISGGTPSMYIMSKERIVELIYGSNKDDYKVLATALREYVTAGNVCYSRLGAWYSSFIGYKTDIEGPTYVLNEASKDDFYTNVFPIVSKSDKKFNIIELENSDEGSSHLGVLCQFAGTEEVEGKLLDVDIADTSKNEYDNTITVIDDVQSYLNENYASSSL